MTRSVAAALGLVVGIFVGALGPFADAEPAPLQVNPVPSTSVTFAASTTTTRPTTSTNLVTTSTSEPSSRARTLLGTFKVTCYGPPLFPAGQVTRSGAPVGPGSIAVDPAVIALGTKLEVEGYGRGVANDTGSAVNGRHVDVWVPDPSPCPWSSARVWSVES